VFDRAAAGRAGDPPDRGCRVVGLGWVPRRGDRVGDDAPPGLVTPVTPSDRGVTGGVTEKYSAKTWT
jgi:hypothetical protein